jgi:AcrR family transcriptional regulator
MVDDEHTAAANPPGRTSQAERLSETRARLLDAVLVSLAERGYAGTSTTEVARRSGLTRGAQLHHFGTKDLMMVAAVEHLTRRVRTADVEAAMADVPSTRRVHAALAVMSQLFTGVLPEAYVELWVASRSLPELADALRASEVVARDAVRALFGREILEHAGPRFEALLDLTLYALRGMTLDVHLADDAERRARADLIVNLEPYLTQALGEQR